MRINEERSEYAGNALAIGTTMTFWSVALFAGGMYIGYTRRWSGSYDAGTADLAMTPVFGVGVGLIGAGLAPENGGSRNGKPLWPRIAAGAGLITMAGELTGVLLAYATR